MGFFNSKTKGKKPKSLGNIVTPGRVLKDPNKQPKDHLEKKPSEMEQWLEWAESAIIMQMDLTGKMMQAIVALARYSGIKPEKFSDLSDAKKQNDEFLQKTMAHSQETLAQRKAEEKGE